ncbi:MAG: GTPase ObgE [Elusimicrobia bacterium]|nr:MAG: GTPase ObgE [Elusimicrobiota bacterium]
MKIIDKVKVFVKAGDGGKGCMSFLREKFREFGGPNGADGGRGGDVVFLADDQIRTLLDFAHKPHIKAEDGRYGRSRDMTGASADDLVVKVPVGTIVYSGGQSLADLSSPGQKIVVAKGGRGGRGNASFKTQHQTAPRIYEKGEPGEEVELQLELKLIADVGLAGFPNAGKSTFLARVSNARPKIADYPFTTLSPNLGIVQHKGRSFVLADIPGLIEGAHEGKGLGGDFLRHVERTRIIIHLIDPVGFDGTSAVDGVKRIEDELKQHSRVLARKPRVLAVNKSDLPEHAEALKKIRARYRKRKIFSISAATGEGVQQILNTVLAELDQLPIEVDVVPPEAAVRKVKVAKGFRVKSLGGGNFVVTGKFVERAAAMTDTNYMEGLYRFQKTLKRIGVERELKSKGVQTGDTVIIGNLELLWSTDPLKKLPRLPRRKQIK